MSPTQTEAEAADWLCWRVSWGASSKTDNGHVVDLIWGLLIRFAAYLFIYIVRSDRAVLKKRKPLAVPYCIALFSSHLLSPSLSPPPCFQRPWKGRIDGVTVCTWVSQLITDVSSLTVPFLRKLQPWPLYTSWKWDRRSVTHWLGRPNPIIYKANLESLVAGLATRPWGDSSQRRSSSYMMVCVGRYILSCPAGTPAAPRNNQYIWKHSA